MSQLKTETSSHEEQTIDESKQETFLNPNLDPSSTKDFGPTVHKITTSQTGDIIYLGNHAFHKHELLNAFGGDLNPGIHAPPSRPLGNPVPLGLASFAVTTFTISLFFLNTRHVTNPQLIAAPAVFVGGTITTITGLWSLIVENTFAAAALGGFGGFYLSYGGILLDSFGVSKAYADSPGEFNSLLGFYLTAWTIYATILWFSTFKATWSFFFLLLFVVLFLLFLAIGYFIDSTGVKKAGGVFGLLASFSAFYAILEGIATKQNSYLVPPSLLLPRAPSV